MIDNGFLKTQKTFRILLQAMCHPGKVYDLESTSNIEGAADSHLTGLMDILETLLDREVSFAVIDADKPLTEEIVAITRSCPVQLPDADFIIVTGGTSNGGIAKGKRGTLEYPDDSATMIYIVHSCEEKKGRNSVILKGPGIEKEAYLEVRGLHGNELKAIKNANTEYPFGVDVIFVDRKSRVSCIPRSAAIMEVS